MPNTKKTKKKDAIAVGLKPTVLAILDGFGLADLKKNGNAVTPETAPNIFSYMKKYSFTKISASGVDVGLFPGQQGNSEAGHLNIGAGRVVKQDLVMISDAIKDGTFFKNEAFKQALRHVKKYDAAAHVVGLLTDKNSAHAYPDHFYALLDFFRKEGQKKVFLHIFTDGRDSSPHGAADFLRQLRSHMKNGEKIATITGRFYAMDRNKIWDRTRLAYEAMVLGRGCGSESAEAALSDAYNRGDTDEFICPTVILEKGKPTGLIKDNDAVYFINARSDRARQITKAFVQPDFEKKNIGAFKRRDKPKNICFVAMTDFGPDLPDIFTAFPSPDVPNSLAQAIDGHYRQLYISETEKYAHVTYFINGGYADPINGEDREVVKSGDIKSYADFPEMNCEKITDKIIGYLSAGKYDFVCVNFPNADMVGHTGNFAATKKAVSVMDGQIKRLVDFVSRAGGQMVILSDHGNAEEMINQKTGGIVTEHTTNPVPFIVIRSNAKNIKLKKGGRLADVAPTLLKLMGIKPPGEMKGKILF